MTTIATSPTIEGITKQIQSYFYSGNIFLTEEEGFYAVNNSTGIIKAFIVVHKGARFRFQRVTK